jgi:hypothetical protein
MNKISLFLLVLLSCSDPDVGSETIKNDTTPVLFSGYTNQEIISKFINYMEWYHEEEEFDKESIEIRRIDNYTYSIKFKTWYWKNIDQFCIDGSTCLKCFNIDYRRKDCSHCKRTGKVTCSKRKIQYSKIATMKFEDQNKFSVLF